MLSCQSDAIDPASINSAIFTGNHLPQGQSPLAVHVQILLDRAGASPGVIDDYSGENLEWASHSFEQVNKMPMDGRNSISSHGCVRMTSWDANELANMVSQGGLIEFRE